MSRYRYAMLVACLLTVPLHQTRAYTILSPGAVVLGKPIADWTADWWTWGAQAPNGPTNPQLDPYARIAAFKISAVRIEPASPREFASRAREVVAP